jgi:hypothetical protein
MTAARAVILALGARRAADGVVSLMLCSGVMCEGLLRVFRALAWWYIALNQWLAMVQFKLCNYRLCILETAEDGFDQDHVRDGMRLWRGSISDIPALALSMDDQPFWKYCPCERHCGATVLERSIAIIAKSLTLRQHQEGTQKRDIPWSAQLQGRWRSWLSHLSYITNPLRSGVHRRSSVRAWVDSFFHLHFHPQY